MQKNLTDAFFVELSVNSMRKRIVYTEHISFRLANRALPYRLPEYVIHTAERFYLDAVKSTYIAVKDVRIGGIVKTFSVAFYDRSDSIALITIHRLKRNQEFNRVKTKRWPRIRRKN